MAPNGVKIDARSGGRAVPGIRRRAASARAVGWTAFLALAALLGGPAAGPVRAEDSDWPVTTGDESGRRYTALDQIDRATVGDLEIAWRWSSPDNDRVAENPRLQSRRMQLGGNQVTPIKIGGRLYATTGLSQIAGIDPGTGETDWVFDPESYAAGRPTNLGFVHRGASYWPGRPAEDGLEAVPGRLFYGTGDARLLAVDPTTGEPVGGFGDGGSVDLATGLRREVKPRRAYAVSSPVMVCQDTVIVGASISDVPNHPDAPPGDVRGFDAVTGELRWTFHSIPQPGEFGHDTWEDGAWEYTGNTNVWTLITADTERGLVYLPFGTPTNDWYGGHRLGDNLFSESLVALDCATGERAWHYQIVRHGLWDYDLVTPPILGDITVDGRALPIAAQLTKQGFVFVFDRESGEEVWPIEERTVPRSEVPGERSSPTQPFPTWPPPYERQGMHEGQLIDFTPEILARAKELMAEYEHGPLYQPPSLGGTWNLPGWAGGASWPGGAFDPETGWLYVPSYTQPVVLTIKKPDPNRSSLDYIGSIQTRVPGPFGLPMTKPPYTRLTAYDLNRGEIEWVRPLGEGPTGHPAIRDLDLGPLGSGSRAHVLLTPELVFVALESVVHPEAEMDSPSVDLEEDALEELGTVSDEQFAELAEVVMSRDWRYEPSTLSALDKTTGETVWSVEVDSAVGGSPMTYMHDGRQYLVVAAGGSGSPAELIAWALPAE